MSDKLEKSRQELLDGLVQLRFSDQDERITDLNAAELAESLLGLVELSGQMARAGLYGEGIAPEIRVRPPEKGSFVIEAIVDWAAANPEGALTMSGSAGAALTQAIHAGLKMIKGGTVANWEDSGDGMVKILWRDESTPTEVPLPVWKELQKGKRQTRRALARILAPLGDQADTLEVRDGTASDTTAEILGTTPSVVAGKDDYRVAVQQVDDTAESTREFDTEAKLSSIDFRRGEKWHLQTLEGNRGATMEDEEFLLKLDRGLALHKNDIFELKIREVQTTKNGRNSRTWSVVKVTHKRRGADDDNQTPSPESTFSAEAESAD